MAITVTVPPSTTKLIALADLKAILGITDNANDALLGNIILRGSDAIARFCNRVFAQRTIIETLPGSGGQLLKLKFAPITTLTSIALDGDIMDSSTYTLTEPDAGVVFCESYWAHTSHQYSYTGIGAISPFIWWRRGRSNQRHVMIRRHALHGWPIEIYGKSHLPVYLWGGLPVGQAFQLAKRAVGFNC